MTAPLYAHKPVTSKVGKHAYRLVDPHRDPKLPPRLVAQIHRVEKESWRWAAIPGDWADNRGLDWDRRGLYRTAHFDTKKAAVETVTRDYLAWAVQLEPTAAEALALATQGYRTALDAIVSTRTNTILQMRRVAMRIEEYLERLKNAVPEDREGVDITDAAEEFMKHAHSIADYAMSNGVYTMANRHADAVLDALKARTSLSPEDAAQVLDQHTAARVAARLGVTKEE